jgi:hypothetical protein
MKSNPYTWSNNYTGGIMDTVQKIRLHWSDGTTNTVFEDDVVDLLLDQTFINDESGKRPVTVVKTERVTVERK